MTSDSSGWGPGRIVHLCMLVCLCGSLLGTATDMWRMVWIPLATVVSDCLRATEGYLGWLLN